MRELLRNSCALGVLIGVFCLGLRPGKAATPDPSPWHQEPGRRWQALPALSGKAAGFTLMEPSATGISATNHLAEAASALNRILENGSGVALGDVDGDGWCDLYFCRLEGPNLLYRNLGGWRFQEITASAGVACEGQYSTGAVFADVDGDGDLDLLVNAIGGGTRLFLNNGQARFTEMTDSRLAKRFGSTSLALADADNDGDLDLYVCNYRTTTYKDRPPGLKVEARKVGDQIVVTPEDRFIPLAVKGGGVEVIEKGERDFFYVNDGAGHFLPVSWTAGSFVDEGGKPLTAPPADWGLSVLFRDLNGDGTPDLYICNDFFAFPDRCWLNEEGKRFRAIAPLGFRHQSLSSMGGDVADLNRDGIFDLFVTDMISRRHEWRQRQRPDLMKGTVRQPMEDPFHRPEAAQNTLQLGLGGGRFAELAYLSGVDATEWSWGAVFLDADLDGYEDLLVPTGNNHDVQDADVIQAHSRRPPPNTIEGRIQDWRDFPPLRTPLLAFRNQHDLTFKEVTADWGFGAPGPFTGAALADLDGDGDLDLVANVLNGPATLYRNDSANPRVAVRLRGEAPNTRGIGALIRVASGPVEQMQEMVAGGRYLSCDDTIRVFATGAANRSLRIAVDWRSGRRSVLENAQPGRLYEIDERQASASAAPAPPAAVPLFEDQSALLGHRHQDAPFDDFGIQPLLSKRLSRLGPGVAWLDLDGDGWEDLVIGAGKGGSLGVYRNQEGRGFVAWTNWTGPTPWPRDTTTILPRFEPGAPRGLLVGVASYEDGRTNASAVVALAKAGDEAVGVVPDLDGSAGPLALADVDNDGQLDLFVGARVRAAQYPVPTHSAMYRRQGNRFDKDAANSAAVAGAGLVSGACFADLDADGWPDLALACEWGPVRVYLNRRGTLVEQTTPLGLAGLSGWWTGVAAGDFDGDGRLDFAAGNWGRNTRFQRHLERPLRAYYGAVEGGIGVALVECHYDARSEKWVPWRDYTTLAMSLPWVTDALPSFRAYGEASVEDVLGAHQSSFSSVEAATLDSMLFLNRGSHFEARPLPVQAQFAPVFALAPGDFDGDGRLDLVLGQNFFGVEPETTRYDGGLGLVLLGDGQGGFRALGRVESGVEAPGEQRGCAAADFDHDGRLDVLLTQNGQATLLYRNRGAKPGLRLSLRGPAGNPSAVGASFRAGDAARWGPVQAIQCGSGHWSVNGKPVVTFAGQMTRLWVRWPGGNEQTVDVPAGTRELEVPLTR